MILVVPMKEAIEVRMEHDPTFVDSYISPSDVMDLLCGNQALPISVVQFWLT